MQFTAEITADHHRDFLRLTVDRVRTPLSVYFTAAFLCAIAVSVVWGLSAMMAAFVDTWQSEDAGSIWQNPWFWVAVLVGFLATLLAFWFINYAGRFVFSAGRHAKGDSLDNSALRPGINLGPVSYDLNPGGITSATVLSRQTLAWSLFKALKETERTFCLLYSPGGGLIVPKNGFGREEDRLAFETLVRGRIEGDS